MIENTNSDDSTDTGDNINPEWTVTAECEECNLSTRASAVPDYCPACGEWGVMGEVQ